MNNKANDLVSMRQQPNICNFLIFGRTYMPVVDFLILHLLEIQIRIKKQNFDPT